MRQILNESPWDNSEKKAIEWAIKNFAAVEGVPAQTKIDGDARVTARNNARIANGTAGADIYADQHLDTDTNDDIRNAKELSANNLKKQNITAYVDKVKTSFIHPLDYCHGKRIFKVKRDAHGNPEFDTNGEPIMEVAHPAETKATKMYIPGIVRILATEVHWETLHENKAKLEKLKKLILVTFWEYKKDRRFPLDVYFNNKSLGELWSEYGHLYSRDLAEWNAGKQQWAEWVAEAREEYESVTGNTVAEPEEQAEQAEQAPQADPNAPEMVNGKFTIGNYNCIRVDNWTALHKWSQYTNHITNQPGSQWCISEKRAHWDNYNCGRTTTVYVLWKDNFRDYSNVPCYEENIPYTDWGKSLICLLVNGYGGWSLRSFCSRYNHFGVNRNGCGYWGDASSGFGDNFATDATKAAKIIGCSADELKEKTPYVANTQLSNPDDESNIQNDNYNPSDHTDVAGYLESGSLDHHRGFRKSNSYDDLGINTYYHHGEYIIIQGTRPLINEWFREVIRLNNYLKVQRLTGGYNLINTSGDYVLDRDVLAIVYIGGNLAYVVLYTNGSRSVTFGNIVNLKTGKYMFKLAFSGFVNNVYSYCQKYDIMPAAFPLITYGENRGTVRVRVLNKNGTIDECEDIPLLESENNVVLIDEKTMSCKTPDGPVILYDMKSHQKLFKSTRAETVSGVSKNGITRIYNSLVDRFIIKNIKTNDTINIIDDDDDFPVPGVTFKRFKSTPHPVMLDSNTQGWIICYDAEEQYYIFNETFTHLYANIHCYYPTNIKIKDGYLYFIPDACSKIVKKIKLDLRDNGETYDNHTDTHESINIDGMSIDDIEIANLTRDEILDNTINGMAIPYSINGGTIFIDYSGETPKVINRSDKRVKHTIIADNDKYFVMQVTNTTARLADCDGNYVTPEFLYSENKDIKNIYYMNLGCWAIKTSATKWNIINADGEPMIRNGAKKILSKFAKDTGIASYTSSGRNVQNLFIKVNGDIKSSVEELMESVNRMNDNIMNESYNSIWYQAAYLLD